MSDLDQLAADLAYAAGAGAQHLSEQVLATARQRTDLGVALSHSPGLAQLAGAEAASVHAESTGLDLGSVADAMVSELADGGAALAVGKR